MAESSHSSDDRQKSSTRPFRFKGSSSSKDGHRRSKRHGREDSRPNQPKDGIHKRPRDRHGHGSAGAPPQLDPDVAFQESLFDAMADDEGAAFWEEVYGQPIHIYSNQRPGPGGDLERMPDEEYVAYVRAKMFEKTHQHLLEEKKRHEEAARRRKKEHAQQEADQHQKAEFERDIEESLRRGRERKRKRHAEEDWNNYLKQWKIVLSAEETKTIPWPTHEGEREDVDEDELSRFFKTAALLDTTRSADDALLQILKTERVRWHPDKMQQRFPSISEADMAAVTAVFQIIDKLWGELRARGSS